MVDLQALGSRIQTMRVEQQLALQELAGRSSVSVSMLSSVERGEKAPTIVVLAHIADGLGVPLARIVGEARTEQVIIRRSAEQETVQEPAGWQRTVFSPVVPGVNFEWIRSTLPAGCDAGTFPAYAPGSHEYVVVVSGVLRLGVGNEVFRLRKGDSAYFAADVEHSFANDGRGTCSYYLAALIMRPRKPRAG